MTKVPVIITKEIKETCKQISPNDQPFFVDIQQVKGARKNKCALNAKDEAIRVKGKVVFGWAVYVWESVYIDFIGHAIVSTCDKQYCVTPSEYDSDRILFLPDERIKFDYENSNSRLPSKTISISRYKVVQRLIEIEKELLEIKIKYPVTSGSITLRGKDAIRAKELEEDGKRFYNMIKVLHRPPKSKCFCGSGRQFRKCCKPKILETFET